MWCSYKLRKAKDYQVYEKHRTHSPSEPPKRGNRFCSLDTRLPAS